MTCDTQQVTCDTRHITHTPPLSVSLCFCPFLSVAVSCYLLLLAHISLGFFLYRRYYSHTSRDSVSPVCGILPISKFSQFQPVRKKNLYRLYIRVVGRSVVAGWADQTSSDQTSQDQTCNNSRNTSIGLFLSTNSS